MERRADRSCLPPSYAKRGRSYAKRAVPRSLFHPLRLLPVQLVVNLEWAHLLPRVDNTTTLVQFRPLPRREREHGPRKTKPIKEKEGKLKACVCDDEPR